jgi:hypothetical protein
MTKSKFFIRWLNYEYWPWWFFYLPMVPYYFYIAIKSRSFAFFSNSNTNIELGGFFGENKFEILAQIPNQFKPITILVDDKLEKNGLISLLESSGLTLPVIVKPVIGERGNDVALVKTIDELYTYHKTNLSSYLIQEFVDFSIELGVLFYRFPDDKKGSITSITSKEFMTVVGDGNSTILDLIRRNDRYLLLEESLISTYKSKLDEVLKNGESFLLEPIGNHCRGTRFINSNHLNNEKLTAVFNSIANQLQGFHYGRFDLKVKSLEELYAGKTIKIMELNGASSEPGHIYDSTFGLINAYREIAHHWDILAKICKQNKKYGHYPVSTNLLLKTVWTHFFSKSKHTS